MPMIERILVCSRMNLYFTTTHNFMTIFCHCGEIIIQIAESVICTSPFSSHSIEEPIEYCFKIYI